MNDIQRKLKGLTPKQFYDLVVKMCNAYLDPVHAAGACYCRECKYHHWEQEPEHGITIHCCEIFNCKVRKDAFCSWGRTEGNHEQVD